MKKDAFVKGIEAASTPTNRVTSLAEFKGKCQVERVVDAVKAKWDAEVNTYNSLSTEAKRVYNEKYSSFAVHYDPLAREECTGAGVDVTNPATWAPQYQAEFNKLCADHDKSPAHIWDTYVTHSKDLIQWVAVEFSDTDITNPAGLSAKLVISYMDVSLGQTKVDIDRKDADVYFNLISEYARCADTAKFDTEVNAMHAKTPKKPVNMLEEAKAIAAKVDIRATFDDDIRYFKDKVAAAVTVGEKIKHENTVAMLEDAKTAHRAAENKILWPNNIKWPKKEVTHSNIRGIRSDIDEHAWYPNDKPMTITCTKPRTTTNVLSNASSGIQPYMWNEYARVVFVDEPSTGMYYWETDMITSEAAKMFCFDIEAHNYDVLTSSFLGDITIAPPSTDNKDYITEGDAEKFKGVWFDKLDQLARDTITVNVKPVPTIDAVTVPTSLPGGSLWPAFEDEYKKLCDDHDAMLTSTLTINTPITTTASLCTGTVTVPTFNNGMIISSPQSGMLTIANSSTMYVNPMEQAVEDAEKRLIDKIDAYFDRVISVELDELRATYHAKCAALSARVDALEHKLGSPTKVKLSDIVDDRK
jgi:hypothetical protein